MGEKTGGEVYSEDATRSLIHGYNEVLGEMSEEMEELKIRNEILKGKLRSVARYNELMEASTQRDGLALHQLEERNADLRLKTAGTRREFLPKTDFPEATLGSPLLVVSDTTIRCILKTKLNGLLSSLWEGYVKLQQRGEELRRELMEQMRTEQVPERCIRCKTLFIAKLVLSVSLI